MSYSSSEGHEGVAQLGVRRRRPAGRGPAAAATPAAGRAAAQDPLGMGPGGVGVDVDHLGLDPQAELHAGPGHVVDERVQAVGPDVGVDGPVAEPGGVVAAAEEPAVVEDEALDPDRGGDVGQLGEAVEGVVEVDRLPRVGDDRALGAGAGRDRPQVGVQAVAHRVEPGAATRSPASTGRGRSRPAARATSPGASSSPPPSRQSPSGVRSAYVVWLPLQAVCTAQTSPRAEGEAGGAGDHEQGGVVARCGRGGRRGGGCPAPTGAAGACAPCTSVR